MQKIEGLSSVLINNINYKNFNSISLRGSPLDFQGEKHIKQPLVHQDNIGDNEIPGQ